MKSVVVFLLTCFAGFYSPAQQVVKVMSYNIRLDVESDGENKWDKRKEKVAALMQYYGADFIGGQEVQHHQLQYLLSTLKGYHHIGVGRDDGKTGGEYSCIFYNGQKFRVLKQGTFWLSETPDTVSMGWDAACHRVCTYGLFQSVATMKRFWVLNTHLDHQGKTARANAAKLIIEKIKAFTNYDAYPVILTGDFNSFPEDEPVQTISTYLKNSRPLSGIPAYGPADTWNAFDYKKKPAGCIDYIFVSGQWKVNRFATITDSYDLKFPSDHFPVLAELQLNSKL